MLNLRNTSLCFVLTLSLIQNTMAESSDTASEESISGIGGTGHQDPETTIEELNIPEIMEIPDVPHTPDIPDTPNIPDVGDFSPPSIFDTTIVIPEPPE